MQGKNILVTGASSGIGEAVTRYFCKEDASVITMARNEQKLQTLKKELGSRLWLCSANVTINCPLRSNRVVPKEKPIISENVGASNIVQKRGI